MPRYWLTPPELDYLRKDCFDPTPYPHSWGDRNALLIDWEKPWYLNPPFHMQTRFVRKAIQQGGPGTIVIPCHTPIHLLLEAGATLRPLGRIHWLEADTKQPMPSGILCLAASIPARSTEPQR